MTNAERHERLWHAALLDAAELLATYAPPGELGFTALQVESAREDPQSEFLRRLRARVDLGRALRFAALLDDLQEQRTVTYRHEVTVSLNAVRGKLHMPSYARSRAAGRWNEFPVIRARRDLTTPENLLIAEVLTRSLRIARAAARVGGAEGTTGVRLLKVLSLVEREQPWTELRNVARPALGELVQIVLGRAVAGVIDFNHAAATAARLFDPAGGGAVAFSAGAGPLSFAATTDPRFADRLFELLCLGWVVDALRAHCTGPVLDPAAFEQGSGQPLFRGSYRTWAVELRFQSGKPLPPPRWVDVHTGRSFRGIPDLVLTVRSTTEARHLVIDPKNRPQAGFSGVAYKMMGYKENFGNSPFKAVAVFPYFGGDIRRHRRLQRDGDSVLLTRVLLTRGRRAAHRLIERYLRAL